MTTETFHVDIDEGYVRLVDFMGDDLSVANAARASFAKQASQMSRAEERLIDFLARNRHDSPFRHAMVTIEIKAPLMVARQWFKYRIGSSHTPDTAELVGTPLEWRGQGDDGGDGWGDLMQARNEASRRYITMEPEFHVPDMEAWRSAPASMKQGSGAPVDVTIGAEATARLEMILGAAMASYHWALSVGIAPEQARLFLPAYALMTTWRWTASVQAIAHFLRQRLAHDAQDEIRRYAEGIRSIVEPRFPVSLKALLK